jgi:rRNA maturation protein Nop10
MPACPDCGVVTLEATRFCPSCGRDNRSIMQYRNSDRYEHQNQYSAPHTHTVAKAFDQIFGIDPRIAFLAFIVDLMLFGAAAETAGIALPVLIPLAIVAGIVLGRITYKAQIKWYGDDPDSAAIKAGIVGLLTAIPVGIPAVVWVPSGLLGLLHNARKKLSLPDHG